MRIDIVPIGTWEFARNLGLAMLVGAAVGLERELRDRDAGVKTNALVAGGAAIFTMMTRTFDDSGRIAAQIVTGIGFLGAGNIIRSGLHVRGLTTAATLWCMAGVGMVAGSGHVRETLLAGGAVLLVNVILLPIERRLGRMRAARGEPPAPDSGDSSLP